MSILYNKENISEDKICHMESARSLVFGYLVAFISSSAMLIYTFITVLEKASRSNANIGFIELLLREVGVFLGAWGFFIFLFSVMLGYKLYEFVKGSLKNSDYTPRACHFCVDSSGIYLPANQNSRKNADWIGIPAENIFSCEYKDGDEYSVSEVRVGLELGKLEYELIRDTLKYEFINELDNKRFMISAKFSGVSAQVYSRLKFIVENTHNK
ncbi:MAG: hypothetical protein P8103_06310 [Candidatus Thiodiazotropha sp.]